MGAIVQWRGGIIKDSIFQLAFTTIKNGSSARKGGTPEDSEVDLVFSF
jgi:hypothetical protein